MMSSVQFSHAAGSESRKLFSVSISEFLHPNYLAAFYSNPSIDKRAPVPLAAITGHGAAE